MGVNTCYYTPEMAHSHTHWKIYFQILSYWMVCDRDDSFPIDFEPNGNPVGSKLKDKLLLRSYSIQYERN